MLKDVNDNGNCFFIAVIDQMNINNHPFINDIPNETNQEDSLRLHV